MSTNALIRLLVWILVAALVVWAVFLLLGMLPLPYPVREIACVIIAVVFLLAILKQLGLLD